MLQHALTNFDIGFCFALCYLVIKSTATRTCICAHFRRISYLGSVGHGFKSVCRYVQINKIISCLFNETTAHSFIVNLLLDFLNSRIGKLGNLCSGMENVHCRHNLFVGYRSIIDIVIRSIAINASDQYVFDFGCFGYRTIIECDIVAVLDYGILIETYLTEKLIAKVKVGNRNLDVTLAIYFTCKRNNVRNKQNLFRVGDSELISVITLYTCNGEIFNSAVIGSKVTLRRNITLVNCNSIARSKRLIFVDEETGTIVYDRTVIRNGNKAIGCFGDKSNILFRYVVQTVSKSDVRNLCLCGKYVEGSNLLV